MFTTTIIQKMEFGYSDWVSSWSCPLCAYYIPNNLLAPFVHADVVDHLVDKHRVTRNRLQVTTHKVRRKEEDDQRI